MTITLFNTQISEFDNKIPDNSSLVTTTVLNTKITEVESKNPDHVKYIASQEFNKLSAENFSVRLTLANLVSKTDFDDELISFNRKITSNKTFRSSKKPKYLTTKEFFLR